MTPGSQEWLPKEGTHLESLSSPPQNLGLGKAFTEGPAAAPATGNLLISFVVSLLLS
jgi:hypothetical protein